MKKIVVFALFISLLISGCHKRPRRPHAVVPVSVNLNEAQMESYYNTGIKAFNERNYREAMHYFYSVWKQDSKYKDVDRYYFESQKNLGLALLKSRNKQEGLQFLEQAEALRPDDNELKLELVKELNRVADSTKNIEQKQKIFEKSYSLKPCSDVAIELFHCYEKTGRLNDGLNLLESHLRDNPDSQPVFELLTKNLSKVDNVRGYKIFSTYYKNMKKTPELDKLRKEMEKNIKGKFLVIAKSEIEDKNWAEAISHLNEAKKLGQESGELYLLLSKAYLGSGNKEQALSSAVKALQYEPSNIEVLNILRNIYQERNETEKLLAVQKKIITIKPFDLNEKLRYADELIDSDRKDEAMTILDDILKKNPGYPQALEKKAIILFQNGDYANAKEIWGSLLKQNQESPEILFYLGICSFRERDLEKASELLRNAIRIEPQESKYYYYYLLVLKDQGKYAEMDQIKQEISDKELKGKFIPYLKKIFGVGASSEPHELSFDKADNFYSVGLSFARKGDYDKAIEYFNKALAKSPDNVDIMLNIGNAYMALKKYNYALLYYLKSDDKNPNNFYVKLFCSRSLWALGLKDMARAYLDAAKTIDSNNSDLAMTENYFNSSNPIKKEGIKEELGYFMLKNQYFDKAKMFLNMALVNSKNKSSIYYNLGNIYHIQGDDRNAEKFLKKSLEENPKLLDSYLSLGKIYASKSREQAIQFYLKGLDIDPNNQELLENVAILYLKGKEYVSARTYYERLRKLVHSPDKAQQIDSILRTIP